MSSKSGRKKLTFRERLSYLRTLSITRRLTILYTLCSLFLLAASAAFLDQILVADMSRENNQFLFGEVYHIRMLLERYPDNVGVWKEEMERETQAPAMAYTKYYVRVLDKDNKTEAESPGMDRIITNPSFPVPSSPGEALEKGVRAVGMDDSPLLLIAAWVEPRPSITGRKLIQIALDISHDEAIVADYREKMVLVLFAGMVLSTFIGFSVAREGLRPLKEMGRAFTRIGAKRLDDRLGPRQWPDEIAVLARAFDKMLERLQNSFVALSQFSANLTHELRTPINNLRGEAEVALYKARSTQEYRQVLESSLEEYERLSRMIENLLFLAGTENANVVFKPSRIDVRKETEALLEFFNAVAEEKEIEVACKGHATLKADLTSFRHTLSNILSNAFQYTPKGGKVTVTAEELDDQSVRISVEDTGIGIEPESLGRIFDRFFRTDRARTEHPQGTGLGFSIVKSIMDLHGGTVTVRSEVDKGTTVTLVFPHS